MSTKLQEFLKQKFSVGNIYYVETTFNEYKSIYYYLLREITPHHFIFLCISSGIILDSNSIEYSHTFPLKLHKKLPEDKTEPDYISEIDKFKLLPKNQRLKIQIEFINSLAEKQIKLVEERKKINLEEHDLNTLQKWVVNLSKQDLMGKD